MEILTMMLIGLGILVLVGIMIKIITKPKSYENSYGYDDDIISLSKSIGSKFDECCVKKIKGMFGGGAYWEKS